VAYQAYAQLDFQVNNPLSAVSLGTTPGSPALAGTAVMLTATATGGLAPQYQFAAYLPGSGWSVVQAYSTANTASWTPAAAGTYLLQATVRETGSSAAYQYYAQQSFRVLPQLSAVALTASPASPVASGATVTLTATSTGGQNPEYQFAVYLVGGPGWTVLQSYGSSATCLWQPAVGGAYVLQVTAREKGSSVAYQVYGQLDFQVSGLSRAVATRPGA
jgi:hypothetical protein